MAYTDDRNHHFSLPVIVNTMLWAIVYRYPRIEPDLAGFIKPFNFQVNLK